MGEGRTTITLTVTAQDGTVGNYVVDVYRTGTVPADYASPNIGTLKGVPTGGFLRDEVQYARNISIVARPFRMSAHEITRAQFLAIMGTDPSDPARSAGTDAPAQRVNWYQAIAFCNKLSLSEGLDPVYSVQGVPDFGALAFADIPTAIDANWDAATADWNADGYRLPTEMEWQWAAMGAEDARDKEFAGDDGTNTLGDCAVFGYDTMLPGHTTNQRSESVGLKLPNELGIYDLTGNVLEWCWDYWGNMPDGKLESDTATGRGPAAGTSRVMRGGAYNWTEAYQLWVSFRDHYDPERQSSNCGFRVVRN